MGSKHILGKSIQNDSGFGFVVTIIIMLLLFAFLKFYISSFIHQYQYFGVNPVLIRYGYPGLNIFLAIVVLLLSASIALVLIKTRKAVRKKKRVLIEVAIFVCVSLFVSCIHSFVYFLNKDAYIVDSDVNKIQENRIEKLYYKSLKNNKEIIDLGKDLKSLIIKKPFEVVKNTDYNILKFKKYIKLVTIYEKNSVFKIELTIFSNIDRLHIYYKERELRVYVSHVDYKDSPPEEKKLKRIFENILKRNNKSDYIDLIDMILLNHNMINDKMEKDRDKMINVGYASIDLFIYDTLLKSIGKDSGDYRASSVFSRSLTFVHTILAYLFISMYGGQRILDALKKKT